MGEWHLGIIRGPTIKTNGKPEPFGNFCEAFGNFFENGVCTKILVGIGYTPLLATWDLEYRLSKFGAKLSSNWYEISYKKE